MTDLNPIATLTTKQAEFVRQLTLCKFDIVEAHERAGYAASSKSEATRGASRLMANPAIQAAINLEFTLTPAVGQISPDRIVQELNRIAFGDVRELLHWDDGALKFRNPSEMSADAVATIKSIEITEREEQHGGKSMKVKIDLWDKLGALNSLARIEGLFEKDQHLALDVNYTTELPSKAPTEAEWLEQVYAIEAESREVDDDLLSC